MRRETTAALPARVCDAMGVRERERGSEGREAVIEGGSEWCGWRGLGMARTEGEGGRACRVPWVR
jgi:hypothetical protein